MILTNDYDTNERSLTKNSSSSSITSLMETKNPLLLIVTSMSTLLTGFAILFTAIFALINMKYLIIEYELGNDTKLILIPVIIFNIFNVMISLYQIYFYYMMNYNGDKTLTKFSYSFFTWNYSIMEVLLGILYIIGSFLVHSVIFLIMKVLDCFLIISLLIPLYKTIKERRGLNTMSTISLSFYFSVLLSLISYYLCYNGIDLIGLLITKDKKYMILYYKLIISNLTQLSIGLSLLAYYKDIIYLMTGCLSFFWISFLLSINEFDKRTYFHVIVFFLTLCIILWFYFQRRYMKRNGTTRESIDPCIPAPDTEEEQD